MNTSRSSIEQLDLVNVAEPALLNDPIVVFANPTSTFLADLPAKLGCHVLRQPIFIIVVSSGRRGLGNINDCTVQYRSQTAFLFLILL